MPQATKRRARSGKGATADRNGRKYRWILASDETWAKVGRIMKRMEARGTFPGKLSVNRVASILFEKALAKAE